MSSRYYYSLSTKYITFRKSLGCRQDRRSIYIYVYIYSLSRLPLYCAFFVMSLVRNEVDVEIVQLLLLLLILPPLFLISQIVVYSCFCFHNCYQPTRLIIIPSLSIPPLPLFVMLLYVNYYSLSIFVVDDDDDIFICWIGRVGISYYYIYCYCPQ